MNIFFDTKVSDSTMNVLFDAKIMDSTNSFLNRAYSLVSKNTEPVYSDQNQELLSMATSAGCDIAEHVPTLVEYGQKCSTITEFGVRYGWSSRSFLFAKPKNLLSVDLYFWDSVSQCGEPGPLTLTDPPGNNQFLRYKKLYEGTVDYNFIQGDTLKIDVIDETDLLFIDTLHHKYCLLNELERHGNQAKRYIILHDTVTFGLLGQNEYMPELPLGKGTGLIYALQEWLPKNPHWKVTEHYINNNGLTIMERR